MKPKSYSLQLPPENPKSAQHPIARSLVARPTSKLAHVGPESPSFESSSSLCPSRLCVSIAAGFGSRLRKAGRFSPTAFAVRALVIAALYRISELLGLREYTTFLSGTSANLNLTWQIASVLGLIHLLLYVAFILFVPIFLITAFLLAAWNAWIGSRKLAGQALASDLRTPTNGSP